MGRPLANNSAALNVSPGDIRKDGHALANIQLKDNLISLLVKKYGGIVDGICTECLQGNTVEQLKQIADDLNLQRKANNDFPTEQEYLDSVIR